ncbi:hypothetical protein H2248_003724 [Termitomyces sp. 'cryptogamus']|nr:hypothetical protein H2248_003724 [Termitomyces sp. 'cryptogamus']
MGLALEGDDLNSLGIYRILTRSSTQVKSSAPRKESTQIKLPASESLLCEFTASFAGIAGKTLSAECDVGSSLAYTTMADINFSMSSKVSKIADHYRPSG